jgi:hypothetical protein
MRVQDPEYAPHHSTELFRFPDLCKVSALLEDDQLRVGEPGVHQLTIALDSVRFHNCRRAEATRAGSF